jgi:hypothetical protein
MEIITCNWLQAKPLAAAIRRKVFIEEQAVPESMEWDEDDAGALHFLGLLPDGTAIATARLLPDGRLGRMAVLPPWRRQGLGRQLLDAVMDYACRAGYQPISLHAQTAVRGFYEQAGFVAEGEVFEEAGIPHQRMRHTIGGQP